MKLRNVSQNTLYAEDVDRYIQYEGDKIIEMSPDTLKKSKSIRAFILKGLLDIIEYDPNEQVEIALVYLKNKRSPDPIPEPPPPIVEEKIPPVEEISLAQAEPEIEVKMRGLFYDDSGYGKVNRNLATNLNKSGIKIRIEPKSGKNKLTEEDLQTLVHLEKTEISRDHILIDSIVPSMAEMSSGKYRILYTTVESYTIPQQFLDCCDAYNEIWVTSPWSADILKKYVKKPIYVVPAGVDENLYTEKGPAFDFTPNVKNFVFISVFGWGYRKGYDVLLKSYFDEFSEDDDVSLLIMSKYQGSMSRFHRNKIKEDIEKIMAKFPNKDLPHVLRHNQVVAEKDMPKMYRAANCFVIPTRGEGSCCVTGTKVVTSSGLKPIESVCKGESVLTHTGKFKTVTDTMHRYVDEEIYEISASMDCDKIRITKEHPVLVLKKEKCYKHGKRIHSEFCESNCEWKVPEEINVGDFVLFPINNVVLIDTICDCNTNKRTNSMIYLPVKKISKQHYSGFVYNLEVEEDHSYTTNCFTVHNCLPAVEASMCGLPIIMTNCSGQQMYLRENNSYMIEIDELVEIQRGQMHIHYWDGQKFPALTSEKVHNDLKKTMRSVYENYNEAKKRNKRLQQLVLSNFTWTHTANAAIKRLQEIYRMRNKI